MPDDTLSAAIQEALTICPQSVREIQTIEIVQPGNPYVTSTLELCLCVDTTGSMGGLIDTLITAVQQVVDELQEDFVKVSVAVVEFKGTDDEEPFGEDEDGPPEIITGDRFRTVEVASGELDELVAEGGGDTEEDGYGAICVACAGLPWTETLGNARAIFLLTDAPSHTRTNSLAEASDAMTDLDIKFFYGPYDDGGDGYDDLVDATGGALIEAPDFSTPAALRATLVALLRELSEDEGLDPIYLVNDNVPLIAALETEEVVTFAPRGFALNTSGSGEDGVKGIGITIDNHDLQVSKYLAQASLRTAPVEIRYRVYSSDDSSGPQNNPPITLYLGPVEIQGNKVSGEARWIDIQNSEFPTLFYDKAHFPGL